MTEYLRPPTTLARFDQHFRAVERELVARLDAVRAHLRHAGNKGSLAETAFRKALSRFLPRRLGIGQGEVIDSADNTSTQLDVVIATDAHPNWFLPDEPSLFLIEAVAAVAEVKSILTSSHLATAIESARRFRKLTPD